MKIKDACLEKTLRQLSSKNKNQFPESHLNDPFWTRYCLMADKLNKDYHPHVQAGNTAIDGGLLTDHGPNHIRTVMNRAAALLDNPANSNNALSGYEIYLLLCAIHFHDIGNMLGREEHEKRISVMMEDVKSHLGDEVEKRQIREIAETHGGKIGDDPDTISHLPPKPTIFGKDIRPKMLAAILRFADELADDSQRANRTLAQFDAIPPQSEIFHKYAECLHSVNVRDECKSVELNFEIDARDLVKKFGKINKTTGLVDQIYLLDEIFSRTLKMHLERIYCNRFMAPVVHVHSIIVKIQLRKPRQNVGEILPSIHYRLEDSGYPEVPSNGIYSVASELLRWGANEDHIDGKFFAELLQSTVLDGDETNG